MRKLIDFTKGINSGTPQFRITESSDPKAVIYPYYNQLDLQNDVSGIFTDGVERKTVKTTDKVCTLGAGDVIFSLISGTSAIVQPKHQGYLYTQNYVTLIPDSCIDSGFLVYLLNEDPGIQKQWAASLQGSMVTKYTIGQLKALTISSWPNLETQRAIGPLVKST